MRAGSRMLEVKTGRSLWGCSQWWRGAMARLAGQHLAPLCLLSLLVAATNGPAGAAEMVLRGPVAPTVTAVKVDQPPKIDGRLDDECWKSATHVAGFWRLDNGAPEYEPTEAWICYDRENIYVAWYCHDSQPSKIVAQQRKRGGSLRADDWVGIDLDIDFTKQRAYWFDVSAGGVQVESIPGGAAGKIEWRGDWQAGTTRTADGWRAEIALPLTIFRYPRGQSTFGFVLIRRLAREDDWSVWPSIGPGFELSREAAWTGLELPPPEQGSAIMPYVLAEVGETGNRGVTAGLDVKRRFPNGLQGMFSYNPDFRDVEDVVETIDFTYVERYLPEYRPFFLEGGGFGPDSRTFYSRRIADFDAGVKGFGQTGQHGIGALLTEELGQASNLVLNERYDLTPYRSVGASLVSHLASGEPNSLAYGLSTGQRFCKEDGESGYWANWDHSRGGDADDSGDAASAGWHAGRTRGNTGTDWDVGWEDISSGFAPALGYVPEVGVCSTWFNLGRRRRYDTGPALAREVYLHLGQGSAPAGRRWYAGVDAFLSRRDQRGFWVGASSGSRDGFDEHTLSLTTQWHNRDIYRGGDVSFSYGERLQHPYRYLSLSQGGRLGDRLSFRMRAEHVYSSELDEDAKPTPAWSRQQYVLALTYDVTWERAVSARLVRRDDGTNWYLAYRQKVRQGTDAWMIVGDPNAPRFARRVAVKLVRVF